MFKKLIGIFLVLAFAAAGTAPENLQVLKYKDLQLTKNHMKEISRDLGVKCKFCHDLDDFSDDGNKHKTLSRTMMRMVITVNTDFLNWKDADQVTCWSCHQGKKYPPKKK